MEFKYITYTYSAPPAPPAPPRPPAAQTKQKQPPPGWRLVHHTTYAGLKKQIADLQKQKLEDDASISIAKSVISALSERLCERPKGTVVCDSSQAKQKLEMANNIVDLVAENTALRKRGTLTWSNGSFRTRGASSSSS